MVVVFLQVYGSTDGGNEMRAIFRRHIVELTRIAAIYAVFGFATAVGQVTNTGEPAVETHISCNDPDVPILILQVEFPDDTAIFENALRTEVCEYADELITVTPVFFLEKVKAISSAAEPYGYIWAIRLNNRKVSYWYFWKSEHEVMLKKLHSI